MLMANKLDCFRVGPRGDIGSVDVYYWSITCNVTPTPIRVGIPFKIQLLPYLHCAK